MVEWRGEHEEGHTRDTSRTTGVDSWLVMGAFAAMLVMGATAAMVGPAGTQLYEDVSAESTSDRPSAERHSGGRVKESAARGRERRLPLRSGVPRARELGCRGPTPRAMTCRGGVW